MPPFFAQMPTADAAAEITAPCYRLKTLHGLNGRMLALDRQHMTLDHIGDFVDFPDDVVDAACAAAASLVVAPFSISLGNLVSFGRNAERLSLVLRESDVVNAGLASFQQALWGGTGPERRSWPGPYSLHSQRHAAVRPEIFGRAGRVAHTVGCRGFRPVAQLCR